MKYEFSKEMDANLTDEEVAMVAQEIFDGERKLWELQAEVRGQRELLARWFLKHPQALKQQVAHGYYSPVICWSQKERDYLRKKARALGVSEQRMSDWARRHGIVQPRCHIMLNGGWGNRKVPAVKTSSGLIRKAFPWEKPQNDRWGFLR